MHDDAPGVETLIERASGARAVNCPDAELVLQTVIHLTVTF